MLTVKALSDRKWERIPALRAILEKEKVPGDYYGLTSVDDNMFDRIARLLEISVIIKSNRELVSKKTDSENISNIATDICCVVRELIDESIYLAKLSQQVSMVALPLIEERLSELDMMMVKIKDEYEKLKNIEKFLRNTTNKL